MDGAAIGDRSVLNGTIVGKKAKIGKGCNLNNCEVQDAHLLNDHTGGLEDGMDYDEGTTQSVEGSDVGEDFQSS